jgi:hypothetical protein
MEIQTLDEIYSNASSRVPLKNTLGASVLKQKSIDYLVKEIQQTPSFNSIRTSDIELILRCCNIIEEFDKSKLKNVDSIKYNSFKKAGLNKKDIVIDSFNKVFNLSAAEKLLLDNSIQFLFDHSKISSEKSRKKIFRFIIDCGKFFLNRII